MYFQTFWIYSGSEKKAFPEVLGTFLPVFRQHSQLALLAVLSFHLVSLLLLHQPGDLSPGEIPPHQFRQFASFHLLNKTRVHWK